LKENEKKEITPRNYTLKIDIVPPSWTNLIEERESGERNLDQI